MFDSFQILATIIQYYISSSLPLKFMNDVNTDKNAGLFIANSVFDNTATVAVPITIRGIPSKETSSATMANDLMNLQHRRFEMTIGDYEYDVDTYITSFVYDGVDDFRRTSMSAIVYLTLYRK